MDLLTVFVGICVLCFSNALSNGSLPEQVHISFGDTPNSMVVMWSSRDPVQYNVTYWTTRDQRGGWTGSDVRRFPKEAAKAAPYVHRSVLKNLTEEAQYFYQIVPQLPDDNTTLHVESEIFSFTTLPKTKKESPYRFLVFGDMGANGNIPTYAELEKLAASGNYAAILHVGDMAYDLDADMGKVGDRFFNNIQPFASQVPYMPSPGNHEIADDFIHYRLRFSTPNTPWPIPLDKMWYSYDIGPVHFISYSTEVFFTYNEYYVCKQFDWLLQDLIAANRNRDKQPWVIAVGHRPMYCSNNNGDDCTSRFFRRWVQYGLEDLFYAQGVDMIIQAHEHSYERLWPVYQNEVYGQNYVNPRAPVHITSGAAGGPEGVDWMEEGIRYKWSAFKADKTSRFTFGQIEVYNATHLYFEQRESRANKTLDGVWIVQSAHGPFVANLTCEGKDRHNSCSCPPRILYIFYFVGAGTSVVVVLVVALVVCRCKRRDRHSGSCLGKRSAKYTEIHEECECEKLFKDCAEIAAQEESEQTHSHVKDRSIETANHGEEDTSRVIDSVTKNSNATYDGDLPRDQVEEDDIINGPGEFCFTPE